MVVGGVPARREEIRKEPVGECRVEAWVTLSERVTPRSAFESNLEPHLCVHGICPHGICRCWLACLTVYVMAPPKARHHSPAPAPPGFLADPRGAHECVLKDPDALSEA